LQSDTTQHFSSNDVEKRGQIQYLGPLFGDAAARAGSSQAAKKGKFTRFNA
jgi:hypothetical protein